MTELLLRPFREQNAPVIGFVNEGRAGQLGPQGLRQILDLWLDSGAIWETIPIRTSTSTTCLWKNTRRTS